MDMMDQGSAQLLECGFFSTKFEQAKKMLSMFLLY
jgi:hypothetical protein